MKTILTGAELYSVYSFHFKMQNPITQTSNPFEISKYDTDLPCPESSIFYSLTTRRVENFWELGNFRQNAGNFVESKKRLWRRF